MAWIAVQKKGFEQWCNAKLSASRSSSRINDLASDFCDGVLLGELVELLSGKRVATVRPKLKVHQLANIGKSLEVIKSEEIKLVNTSAEDIQAGNIKIILGFVWALILRYQIQASAQESSVSSASPPAQKGGVSPKEELLIWLQGQVAGSGVPCHDFQKSFQDGKLLCALVNSIQPGQIPPDKISSLSPLDRTIQAIDAATLNFDVLCILAPNDIVNTPDELCMMTYISMFRVAARCSRKPSQTISTVATSAVNATTATAEPSEEEEETENLLDTLTHMGLADHKEEEDDYDDIYQWMGDDRKKKWYAFVDKTRIDQKKAIADLTTATKTKLFGLPESKKVIHAYLDGMAISMPKLWGSLFGMVEAHFQRIVSEQTVVTDEEHKERALKLAMRVWESATRKFLAKFSATCADYKKDNSMFFSLMNLPSAKDKISAEDLARNLESTGEMVGFDLDGSVGMFGIRKEHRRVEDVLAAALGPNISQIELACARHEGFATYAAWIGHGSFLAQWAVFCKKNRVYE